MPIYADRVVPLMIPSHSSYPHIPPKETKQEWNIGSRVYTDARCKADALKFILENTTPARYHAGDKVPDRYNVVGETELNNLEIAQRVAEIVGKPLQFKMVPSESARPGYDKRYALDGSKLRKLGWEPPFTFEETIERIVKWTLQHKHWLM
jgi:dTDP-glucose 4,6-dehydratase